MIFELYHEVDAAAVEEKAKILGESGQDQNKLIFLIEAALKNVLVHQVENDETQSGYEEKGDQLS